MELKGIQSIEVGFRLLQALEGARAPLTLKELSSQAGLTPSKARNYLVSLKRVELVQQDADTGHYALGPAALRLGLVALAQIEPLEIAFDEMKLRRDRIGATQFLSVWGNKGPVIVRWLEGEDQITVEVRTGSVLPATRSCHGNRISDTSAGFGVQARGRDGTGRPTTNTSNLAVGDCTN